MASRFDSHLRRTATFHASRSTPLRCMESDIAEMLADAFLNEGSFCRQFDTVTFAVLEVTSDERTV